MKIFCSLAVVWLLLPYAHAQGTVPTFQQTTSQGSYTFAGGDPTRGGTTAIPTLLVPIRLTLQAPNGRAVTVDAPSSEEIVRSPVFSRYPFPSGGHTQYADALLRSSLKSKDDWHTILSKPEVKPISITVPAADGYILTSRKSGRSIAIVDLEFLEREVFKLVPKQEGKLVIAVARNTTYYAYGDATICCSWGTHGIDTATGNSFVLASYLSEPPSIVRERDVQPLTEQLAEFVYDPLHQPLLHGDFRTAPGNHFSSWTRPGGESCSGNSVGSNYFLLEPTDLNLKNNFPASQPFLARSTDAAYHVQNVPLLSWYQGGSAQPYSFPDAQVLTHAAVPCHPRTAAGAALPPVNDSDLGSGNLAHGHKLIGYWVGSDRTGNIFPLRQVSPQWDLILVAFASPDHSAPEGTLRFRVPPGIDPAQFKADVAYLKSRGKKVMISLGGGGEYFTLDKAQSIPNFVSSVTQIVTEYGFDGVDIDFENPSLALADGDTDFRHPTTPSIVNLIRGLRQLHNHFGPGFMISLVPEGSQLAAGHSTYSGQFGSYLALTYGLRDILSFVDMQDYNTPPLEGLDGEIYQSHTVDYHAAMTELMLHGFPVAGAHGGLFPAVSADRIAVGFLVGYEQPETVREAMQYIITGKAPAGATYKLLRPDGYPNMIGAMFWTIDDDRRDGYSFSNSVGPQLHRYGK